MKHNPLACVKHSEFDALAMANRILTLTEKMESQRDEFDQPVFNKWSPLVPFGINDLEIEEMESYRLPKQPILGNFLHKQNVLFM